MSAFAVSQLLAAIAICFDLLSFQFKERRQIIACLIVSCLLIATHFMLLNLRTAMGLAALAALRFVVSYLTTSKKAMAGFILAAIAVTAATFQGPLSLLCCMGTIAGTIAAFCRADRRLRQLMMLATCLWLIHNIFAGTPLAVLMEALFLVSNLAGYYRFYWRKPLQLGKTMDCSVSPRRREP